MSGRDLQSKTAIKTSTYDTSVESTYTNSSVAFYSGSMIVNLLEDRTRNVADNSTAIFHVRDLVCMVCTEHNICLLHILLYNCWKKVAIFLLFGRKKDD